MWKNVGFLGIPPLCTWILDDPLKDVLVTFFPKKVKKEKKKVLPTRYNFPTDHENVIYNLHIGTWYV